MRADEPRAGRDGTEGGAVTNGMAPTGEREARTAPPPRAPRRVVRVSDLLGSAPKATLLHAGAEYRLRITRNGKLILTK